MVHGKKLYVYKKGEEKGFWCNRLVETLKYILGNPKETVWTVHDLETNTFRYYDQAALESASFK